MRCRATGEKDVKIKVLYCGICHTDIQNATNGWGASTYPVVPGYTSTSVTSPTTSQQIYCLF